MLIVVSKLKNAHFTFFVYSRSQWKSETFRNFLAFDLNGRFFESGGTNCCFLCTLVVFLRFLEKQLRKSASNNRKIREECGDLHGTRTIEGIRH